MAEIKVGDKVRLTQDVEYSYHKKGDIGVVASYDSIISGLLRVRMGYNNTCEGTTPFEPYEIELVEDVKVFKVGDYFTNTDKDVVWKVTGFPSRDEVKTKALMVTDELDFAETVTLPRGVVLSLDGATPEQIEAFENHPYWGKQEPVAVAISPEEDAVNHPSHYTSDPSGVECLQITRHRNFNIGNAIKYLWRAGLKKSEGRSEQEKQIEDLKKAVFYIQDEIKRLES